jgi:CO/xanthine dehydrogenase Mo-binding subunit
MAPTIGTSTSRVDGRAKVTGLAKYAAEFNTADLVHGVVVSSTITKGRIVRIDASHALAFPGVIDVVTHDNRPDMASTDKSYHDDVAPRAVRRSVRSTTTGSGSTVSRSRWCWPRISRRRPLRRRW